MYMFSPVGCRVALIEIPSAGALFTIIVFSMLSPISDMFDFTSVRHLLPKS